VILVISVIMFSIFLIRMLLILFVTEYDVIMIVNIWLNRIKLQQLNIDQPLPFMRLYSEFSRNFILSRRTHTIVRIMLMMIMSLIVPIMIAMRILIVLEERLMSNLLFTMIVRSILVSLISRMWIRMLVLLMIGLIVRECRHHVIRSKKRWP